MGLPTGGVPALIAPLIAFDGAFLLLLLIYWCSVASREASRTVAFGWASSCRARFRAFTHGANDAQKTMGVIALALFATAI